jgi:hypothetical protein
MITRVLLCGICLIGIHAGTGIAQTLGSRADTPVADQPKVVDGTSKTPSNIPEIIRQPDGQDDLSRTRAVTEPNAALTSPTVNLQFLRAIRLDWDQLGRTAPQQRLPAQ